GSERLDEAARPPQEEYLARTPPRSEAKTPVPARGPTPGAGPRSERVIDAGEHGRAFRAVADVDEADDLRPHHAAEAETGDVVQIGHRRIRDVVEHLAGLQKRRQLELEVRAEELVVPDPGAQLGAGERTIEVDEPL